MEQKGQNGQEQILVGIDVGSTTTKVAVMEVATGKVLFSDYTRHHSDQLQSVSRAVKLVKETLAGRSFLTAMTGSGAKHLSEELEIPYVQEVVANSIALKAMYGEIGTAIELGGQDAKIIFFQRDKRTGELQVADMRMNGSCAGGTGAFVDEIASLLKTPVEEFDALAAQGTTVYDISGRCGVYAKTDIQPLLNQGVKKSDLALSSFHAIAKQTIGGLAQGLSIEKPVVFEGGPLTFNRTLVRVFAERLDLRPEEILSPDRPELLIACGAARAAVKLFSKEEALATADGLLDRIEKVRAAREEAKKQSEAGNGDEMAEGTFRSRPFFADQAAQTEFQERHRRPERKTVYPQSGSTLRAYLGIDSGSTTTKFVLLDENEELLDSFYAPNQGDPLTVAKKALIAMREKYASHGVRLEILAAGTTGYGEMLFSRAFSTETHAVETVAHARAAAKYTPDATFLLDIGGQDMKAIWLDNGVITNIVVNEACSSGCGSFLENFASSLHIPAREIAEKAFSSQHPAALGSRCTVFMTSSIVTEQRNGKLPEDIMAGLCRSIIENVFTKVIRVSNLDSLVKKKVDRIFMPSIAAIGSENTESTSESMCAVVKGYPLVIRNSDSPEKQWGIPFDAPLFYWYREEDKERQLITYMEQTFSIQPSETKKAVLAGNDAMRQFGSRLKEAGAKVLEEVEKEGRYAVVLASRPYQNDALVNHSLPELLTEFGVPVLTADSVPGIENVDLSHSRLDVVNNYHARMLASAVLAAQSQNLEYVQFVSFGCGHDAYLSDEIQRMMREISGKSPLILKLDESEVQGPLRIRVRSFLETINMRRKKREMAERLQNQPGTSRQENAGGGNECGTAALGPDIQKSWQVHELSDPYPVKFEVDDRKKRTVLVPNTSHAFCRIMSAALKTQGIRAVPLAVGREEAIRLGKQYVHNDICFPAQIVIGEALAALRSGQYVPSETAIGMGKYIGDCRLTHYGALLRKALDDAGYPEVAILTNDDVDYHDLHPGFRMNLMSAIRLAGALPMIDILEELLRKIRPYEKVSGSSDQAFDEAMDFVVDGLEQHGLSGALRGFKKAIQRMNAIEYDRSQPRPRVLIVGEYLLNFHPGANHEIERYLEKNGFEIIEARMTDVIRKTYFCQDEQIRTYHLKKPFVKKNWYHVANRVFDAVHAAADRIAKQHPLYTPVCRLPELVKESDPIIPHTFDAGEGVLIPGEILHHAAHGCRAFVILQPFGCLPNHVVGRGIVKKMREMYPDAQILPLDYDPDVSFANLENRLQMLIMNVKERSVDTVALPDAGQRSPVETMNRKQKNADNKKQKVS